MWDFDGKTRTTSRVSSGLEQYTALAATADGRRLLASVVNAQVSLWSVPITSRLVEERDVEAFQLPTSRSRAPRFGGQTFFYLSSRDGADGLWSYRDGKSAGDLEGVRRRAAVASRGVCGREWRCVCTEARGEAADANNDDGWNASSPSFERC